MVHLVSGKNHEGYMRVLLRTWLSLRRPVAEMPAKSALTQIRSRVSYQFFEDTFKKQIADFEALRPKYRGFHIYAIDGDQMTLPQSPDILRKGYRGYPCKDAKETYYPRMYVTHAVDVICGVTKDIAHSITNNECAAAVQMARSFEKNSITLYDRLYDRPCQGISFELIIKPKTTSSPGAVVGPLSGKLSDFLETGTSEMIPSRSRA